MEVAVKVELWGIGIWSCQIFVSALSGKKYS